MKDTSFEVTTKGKSRFLKSYNKEFGETPHWSWDGLILGFPFTYKNGGTGGFRSVLLVEPTKDVGIVILTNTAYDADALAVSVLKSISQ